MHCVNEIKSNSVLLYSREVVCSGSVDIALNFKSLIFSSNYLEGPQILLYLLQKNNLLDTEVALEVSFNSNQAMSITKRKNLWS